LNADNTKSTTDQALYGTEFTALKNSLIAMTDDSVNTKSLFGSGFIVSLNDTLDNGGTGTTDSITVGAAALGTSIGSSGSLLAIGSVDSLSTVIQSVATLRATNGAAQSNLGFQLELQSAAKINQEAAVSRIMDVDVASESTQLARWNTLVQAGTSMIAQANGSTQSALQLLR
jgi:flagellin